MAHTVAKVTSPLLQSDRGGAHQHFRLIRVSGENSRRTERKVQHFVSEPGQSRSTLDNDSSTLTNVGESRPAIQTELKDQRYCAWASSPTVRLCRKNFQNFGYMKIWCGLLPRGHRQARSPMSPKLFRCSWLRCLQLPTRLHRGKRIIGDGYFPSLTSLPSLLQ